MVKFPGQHNAAYTTNVLLQNTNTRLNFWYSNKKKIFSMGKPPQKFCVVHPLSDSKPTKRHRGHQQRATPEDPQGERRSGYLAVARTFPGAQRLHRPLPALPKRLLDERRDGVRHPRRRLPADPFGC